MQKVKHFAKLGYFSKFELFFITFNSSLNCPKVESIQLHTSLNEEKKK